MTRRKFLPLLASTPFHHGCRRRKTEFSWSGVLFHNPVSVRYRSEHNLNNPISKQVRTLEKIFSLYEPSSELALLNSAGSSLSPSPELLQLLEKCQHFHQLTQGLFDPTIQSYWSWLNAQNQLGKQPTKEERDHARAQVDFSKVQINPNGIQLNGTQLTLNSVAQGFASDQLAEYLKNEGVHSALVNLGEYRAISGPFEIEIRHPSAPKRILETIAIQDRSLAVSSGSGHRLSATGKDNHILSPLTGQSPPASRTVVTLAPDATTADAWATMISLKPSLITDLPEGIEARVY